MKTCLSLLSVILVYFLTLSCQSNDPPANFQSQESTPNENDSVVGDTAQTMDKNNQTSLMNTQENINHKSDSLTLEGSDNLKGGTMLDLGDAIQLLQIKASEHLQKSIAQS